MWNSTLSHFDGHLGTSHCFYVFTDGMEPALSSSLLSDILLTPFGSDALPCLDSYQSRRNFTPEDDRIINGLWKTGWRLTVSSASTYYRCTLHNVCAVM